MRMENGIFDYLFCESSTVKDSKNIWKPAERGMSMDNTILWENRKCTKWIYNDSCFILDKQFSFAVRSPLFALFVPIPMWIADVKENFSWIILTCTVSMEAAMRGLSF